MKSRHIVVAIICVVIASAAWIACSRAIDDAAINSGVQAKIGSEAMLAGKTITVQTSGGTVALSGTVANEAERMAAENAARQVPGVKNVTNNLQVVAAAPAPQVAAQTPPPVPAKPGTVKVRANKPVAAPAAQPEAAKPAAGQTTSAPPELANITIPEGTNLSIRLIDPVDTAKNKEGDTFRASLDEPVVVGEKTIIPKHSDVEVKLVSAKSAGHFTGSSSVVLVAAKVKVGGKMYDLQTGEFTKQGSSRGKRTAAVVGGGAAAGAVIGGIVGGGKGAALGAAAGAGAGTGVQALTKGQQVQLPSETVLEFQLKAPLTVPMPAAGTREKAS